MLVFCQKLDFFVNFQLAISPPLLGAEQSSWYQDTSTLRGLSIAQGLVTQFHRKRMHAGHHNSQSFAVNFMLSGPQIAYVFLPTDSKSTQLRPVWFVMPRSYFCHFCGIRRILMLLIITKNLAQSIDLEE